MLSERRVYDFGHIVFRRDPSTRRFRGHASTFRQPYAIGDPMRGGFLEQIDNRAFDRAIAEDQDVRLLFNHDPNFLLGRTRSGTMQLSTDKRGLAVEADLPDTSLGHDLTVLMERGDLDQMSFGFVVTADEWKMQKDGAELRTILDVDLFDTSLVTFPANPNTSAALRAAQMIDDGIAQVIRGRNLQRHAEMLKRLPLRTPGT